jgi:hypothetical protein
MGVFDSYHDDLTEYLTNLFNRTDSESIEALDRLVVELGDPFFDCWKKAHETVVRKWLSSLDTSVVNLLKATGLYPNVLRLEQHWRFTEHSQVYSGGGRQKVSVSVEKMYNINMIENKSRNFNNYGHIAQLNQSADHSTMVVTQNNNPIMAELQTRIDNLLAAVPKDTPETTGKIKESIETIQAEMESPAPKYGMIRTVLEGLKNVVVESAEFATALASLVQFFGG